MTGRVPRHICPRRNLLLFRLTTFVVSGCSSCFGFSWRSNESCDCCFFVCFCLVGVLFVVVVVVVFVAVSVVASVIGVVFVVDSIKAGANDEVRIVTGVSVLIVIADVVFELDVVLLRVVFFELTATAVVVVVAVVVGVDAFVVNFVIVGADLLLDVVVS